ncbi:MAG: chorismate mutase [Sedimentibacter sp.]|uniref:chorismate mutase n=1 Tax=Sedimentibacter sp. TaxID=1960295 RepID=UPI002980E2AD|nr:chorismate mutase [Sedimentibacter sp.]MDW5300129.1 chorismate mutase [Sedimentibacter sp.]
MELDKARIEINTIDKEMVKLLEKRFNLVLQIGQYKKDNSIPVYDEVREKKVIESCVNNLENNMYSQHIEAIYKQIMNTCKELEK